MDGATTEYVLDTSAGLSAGVAGGPSTAFRTSLPEVIVATSGGASTYYVQVGGQILAQYGSGVWAYALPDHLGSVRQLTNAGGQVTLAQGYDPFGVLFETAGSGASEFGYTLPHRAIETFCHRAIVLASVTQRAIGVLMA